MQSTASFRYPLLWAGLIALLVAVAVAPPGVAAAPPAGEDDSWLAAASPRNAKFRADSGRRAANGKFPKAKPKIGTERTWLAVDDTLSDRQSFQLFMYFKDFTLRGVGDHIEVWVASDEDWASRNLEFPYGDCRNADPSLTQISDGQIQDLIREFETTIYPRQSEFFFEPAPRDGKDAWLPTLFPSIPSSAYKGEGDNLVVLVDNIRDANFYEPRAPQGVGGFVVGFWMDREFDRHVVTVDGVAWKHRLGSDPVNAPAPGDPCRHFPAEPQRIESVLSHEYNHILQDERDSLGAEKRWLFEGLASWTETLTGHTDAAGDGPNNSFVNCFLGRFVGCGPENSLNAWFEGPPRADYGAAVTFMHYLHARLGDEVIQGLMADDRHGFRSLEGLLRQLGAADETVADLVPGWSAMSALDAVLDDGASLSGGDPARFSAPALHASVNLSNPLSHDRVAGVVPNGSDFVRLRDGQGAALPAGGVQSVEFRADRAVLDRLPWEVDTDGHGPGDGALWSGAANDVDRSVVTDVDVPVDDPVLRFTTRYELEPGWDYGFVQVSADGGRTFRSLPARTTTDGSNHTPEFHSDIPRELPGFTGSSGGWIQEEVDLSAYAGRRVRLALRFISDRFQLSGGFWVDDLRVGGTTISDGSSLARWRPMHPAKLSVRLVAHGGPGDPAWVHDLALDDELRGRLDASEIPAAIGTSAHTVAAVVTYTEPSEQLLAPARYVLGVNGIRQPGG